MTMMIGSYAYSTFSHRWGQEVGKFSQTFEKAKEATLLPRVIRGLFPYIVRNSSGSARIYFEGNSDGFVGVVQNAMFDSNTPAVVRFSVEQSADFSYRLLYEEWPMYQQTFDLVEQDFDFTNHFELLAKQGDIQFEYFGWYSNKVKGFVSSPPIGVESRGWYREYNSLEAGLFPEKIRITLTQNQQPKVWEFDLSDLHPNWLLWNDEKNHDV